MLFKNNAGFIFIYLFICMYVCIYLTIFLKKYIFKDGAITHSILLVEGQLDESKQFF